MGSIRPAKKKCDGWSFMCMILSACAVASLWVDGCSDSIFIDVVYVDLSMCGYLLLPGMKQFCVAVFVVRMWEGYAATSVYMLPDVWLEYGKRV
jgi:hypothetical protein